MCDILRSKQRGTPENNILDQKLKGENTMNNTNKIKRTIASLLAAAMVMTTAASFAASADELPSASASNTVTVDQVIDLGVDTLFTGIEEYVPGGKFLVPFLKPIANDLLGKGKELSLDDINARIDDMFKKLDDLNDSLRDSIENITAIQSFDSFHFKTFNSQIQEIISQIEVIRKLKISEENKYAQIADRSHQKAEDLGGKQIRTDRCAGKQQQLLG